MKCTTATFLTHGLLSGFAGKSAFTTHKRSGFSLMASHVEQDGNIYHDEWAGNRTGGGQELVKIGELTYTRVYAGGTIANDTLEQLGITKQDIMTFLIKMLNTAGEKTRLHEHFGPFIDHEWTYRYTILEKNDTIPMTTGKEDILYKGVLVFTHVFVLCPVE